MQEEKKEKLEDEKIDNDEIKLDNQVADDVLEKMTDELPEISQDAVDSAKEEQQLKAQQIEKYSNRIDRNGRTFDPSIHLTDENGIPILTKAGRLRISKNGASTGKGSPKLNLPNQNLIADQQKNDATRRYSAEMCASLFIQITSGLFGDEWQPEKEPVDERLFLVDSTDEYFKHAGVIEPPPWVVICIAYGTYSIKRLNKPKTKTMTEKIKENLKIWWIKKFDKKGKKENGTFSNSRDNGKRENNVSVSDGEEVQK